MKRLILVAGAGASLAGIAWARDADLRSRLAHAECTWGSESDLTELRKEVRALRAEAERTRSAPRARLAHPAEALAAATESAHHEDEHLTEEEDVEQMESPSADDGAAEYQRHLAAVAERYARLDTQFRAQARDPRWAHDHEQQIVALPAQHEYFRATTFQEVECRSDWCRVVAEFTNASDQGTFEETFANFAPGFSSGTMRTVADANPPRTEVYLAREGAGELPR